MPGKKKRGGKKRGGKGGGKKPSQKKKKVDNDLDFLDSMVKENEKKKSQMAKKKSEGEKVKIFDVNQFDLSKGQTWPNPKIPLQYLFKDVKYNPGQLQDYSEDYNMKLSNEQREAKVVDDEKQEELYNEMRKAGEVHRQVRRWVQTILRPGVKVHDVANRIEEKVNLLVGYDPRKPLECGLGFPLGMSLNECAAHYTPNPKDNRVIQKDDVMKLDIGTHVKGTICDSAFTMCWDPKYQPLLDAVRAATNAGVKMAGIDVRICDIGKEIEEVMESHECVIDGKALPVKVIRNLCGHSIGRYKIHDGVSVSCVGDKSEDDDEDLRLEENHFYAIETFGCINGEGFIHNEPDTSHFMLHYQEYPNILTDSFSKLKITDPKEKKFFNFIKKTFGTICFSRRYLNRIGQKRYYMALKGLRDKGIIKGYDPLCDIPGSKVSQFEHTFRLRPTRKEVISRGDDY